MKGKGNYKGKRKSKAKDERSNEDRRASSGSTYRRADARDRSTDGADKRLSGLNDMSWYDRNPLLTKAAASIPFPYRPGMKMPISLGSTSYGSYEIPGVMQLAWVPTIGTANTPTDPAAIAGKEVYAQVRNAYAGTLDADAPDYIIYFMALDSIFSYIGSLKRIFRILQSYTPMNYDIPDVLLYALGVPKSVIPVLKENRMQLFQVINELIGMTHKFRCPAVFDIFNRHYWLNDNVYTDTNSPNSQLFVFYQAAYYKFALQKTPDDVDAGGLVMVSSPWSSTTTVSSLFEFGRTLIDALAESDDGYTISGYLTRAYGDVPSFSVSEITLEESFSPLYVPEVLAQIENAWALTAYSGVWSQSTNNVSQDPKTNSLICNPTLRNASSVDISPMLSIRSDEPSLTDVVEATRLKVHVDASGKITCGSEILTSILVAEKEVMDDSASYYSYNQVTVVNISTPTAQGAADLLSMARATQFDWSPLALIIYNTTSAPSQNLPVFSGDVHNVTVFDAQQLKEMHKVCLYSEFNSFNLR